MKKIWILLILFVFESNFAQVGIGTTTPKQALDVIGKIRVDSTGSIGRTMTSIIGVDGDGVLGRMVLSPDFKITDNIISVSGTTSYSVLDVNLYNDLLDLEGNPCVCYSEDVDIKNLNVGINSTNAHETVIRFAGQTKAFFISGITGGVPGRHILLLNSSEFQMGVRDKDHGGNLSEEENMIDTYGPPGSTTDFTNGQGAIELVYDGDRWIVLNIRE